MRSEPHGRTILRDRKSLTSMLFMIVERFRPGCAPEVYRRFRERGRLAPEGLRYVASWVDLQFERCFQVMEADNEALVREWTAHWEDLVDFEIVPVRTSADAAAIMAGAQRPAALDTREAPFKCCGNEELVILRCPACAHLMVFCTECNTLYPDARDPARRETVRLTRPGDRLTCPSCAVPFEDRAFLTPPHVDKYRATAEQVIAAGLGDLLAKEPAQ